MPREYKGSDGIPYISPRDFYGSNHINYDNAKKISEDDYLLLSKKFSPKLNDIIFPRYGTIGIIRVINYTKPLLVSYSCACIRILNRFINLNYIICYLQSELAQQEIRKYTNKTTQPNVGLQSIKNFLVPLPPINEQNKISEKLEVLLPFIEQYAKKEQELTALHQEFPERLKKSILQAAIQGKLTEQNSNDEPAVELVKRIQAEKERLILEKKIKKPKQHSEIIVRDNFHYEIVDGVERCIDDEIPFEIPESWCWVKLNQLGEIVGGGTPKTDNDTNWSNGNIAWITPADMKNVKGKYISHGERYITLEGLNSSSTRMLSASSIVYSSRAPIGYIAITNNTLCTNQGFKSIDLYNKSIVDYLYYGLIYFTPLIQSRASGTTFKEISGADLGKILIPIPPLSEQKRIVAKIEQLFLSLENLG
ncbi:Probable type I restriction-modification system specificity determinant [Canicola haemoglobinophilus]|uniref:Probable type I restriction-modification system specificity determinant n=3 Tax=Canicola haemoglobinophilus TaxID=733 RepID=A0A377HQU2_9PAST|nr:Probable type I restriction-modification system specificity determinant [Canicola haemoglobinophilus]